MKFISKLISLCLTLISAFTVYMVYRLNILPAKYFWPIVVIFSLIVLFLDLKLIRKKTKGFSRFFFMVLSSFCVVGLIYLLTYINATYDFMNSLVFKDYEFATYDVVVKSDSSYKKIKNLKNKEIASVSTDKNYDQVKVLINTNIPFKERKIDEVSKLVASFNSDDISSFVIEDNHYELLKEEYPELNNTSKIIKTYKVIVKKEKITNKKDSRDPFILYISGIDRYGKISNVSRSDVNILAVVNPSKEKILLVAIPRDYYVSLYGTDSKDKLTHAGMYGIDTSVKTINNLLDVDIDYYLRINFSTLTKCIDLIGGVDVYSDRTFTSYVDGSIRVEEGVNHMDGKTALAFARERHAYESGDRHRGENQQEIIKAIIGKMTDKKNITKFKDILSSLDGTFETSMSYKNITNLVKMQLDKNIDWNIKSISLDGKGSMMPTYSMGQRRLYVMIPDEKLIEEASEKINETLK